VLPGGFQGHKVPFSMVGKHEALFLTIGFLAQERFKDFQVIN
jgi:hypothetical protein